MLLRLIQLSENNKVSGTKSESFFYVIHIIAIHTDRLPKQYSENLPAEIEKDPQNKTTARSTHSKATSTLQKWYTIYTLYDCFYI